MKQIIENIFRVPDQGKRFFRVVKPLPQGRYQVRDSMGRVLDVDTDTYTDWQIGDGVTVSQGRIVGRAARFIKPKVYEV